MNFEHADSHQDSTMSVDELKSELLQCDKEKLPSLCLKLRESGLDFSLEDLDLMSHYAFLDNNMNHLASQALKDRLAQGNKEMSEAEKILGYYAEHFTEDLRAALLCLAGKGYVISDAGFGDSLSKEHICFFRQSGKNLNIPDSFLEEWRAKGVEFGFSANMVEARFSDKLRLEELKSMWSKLAMLASEFKDEQESSADDSYILE